MSFNIIDIDDPASLTREDILSKLFIFRGEFKLLFEYQKKTLSPDFNRLPIIVVDEEHKSTFNQLYSHATGRTSANPIGSLNKYTDVRILGKLAKSIIELKTYVSSFPGSIIINGGFVVEFKARGDQTYMNIKAVKIDGSTKSGKSFDFTTLLD